MRVHLIPTGDNEYPYAILKLCSDGQYGYLIYGDTRENCIRVARQKGHKVFDDLNQKEVEQ